MELKHKYRWLKHLDFITIDTIVIALCVFMLSGIRFALGGRGFFEFVTIWENQKSFRIILIVFIGAHIVISLMSNSYAGILRRTFLKELRVMIWHCVKMMVIVLGVLFSINLSSAYSRFVIYSSTIVSCLLIWLVNSGWKKFILKRNKHAQEKRFLVVTDQKHIDETINGLSKGSDTTFKIIGIGLIKQPDAKLKIVDGKYKGYPIIGIEKEIYKYCVSHEIDGVVLNLGKMRVMEMREYAETLVNMGITVHMVTNIFTQDMKYAEFGHLNNLRTISTSIHAYSPVDVIIKRSADIFFSLLGLIATGILFIFVAPMIKISDPSGGVFFKQRRVGKNGKTFYMYKFRTMYSDAEERKKELMARNEMQGNMFKIDGDPRILGSGKDGQRKGLGYWLRVWSIDEFPNSFSILKGDMSVIGTRPPTEDEYEKYELHHKSRLAVKPGLTGMWQVSGRSDITDFEEIVKLDNEYIRNWSLGLDLRIALKTFAVVLGRQGSR